MHDIRLRGARTHNLRGIDLDLRPGELTVVTGLSGAGKSSLALDTLYSEGQRRFVESFSPYARQFLERLERPPIDELDPVAAAVAVDRRAPVKSSRSTVATMADLEPYLSALFARESTPVCPECDLPAAETDPVRAAQRSVEAHRDATAVVTYEVRVAGTEQYLDARERLAQAGYRRLWVGGEARDLDDVRPSDALGGEGSGALSVVVDRLRLQDDDARRLGAAIEEAWRQGHGAASLHIDPAAPAAAGAAARGAGKKAKRAAAPAPAVPTRVRLVRGLACPGCAREFAPPRAGLFSYQSPVGACAPCRGFGRTIGIDWAKVVPDERRTLAGGAIRPWSGSSTQWERRTLLKFCARRGIPTDAAWASLSEAQRQELRDGEGSWHGGKYPGLAAWFKWLESRTYKMHVRVLLARYRAYDLCADCGGKRLSKESLLYRVGGLDLAAWHGLELREAHLRLRTLVTRNAQGEMARRILAERLAYLERVGLGYLTLDRQARTLSGGEAQRVSLTCALGTSLTGALFVLDEPTVGLHAADIAPLCEAMRELAGRGNAVLVVEHDPLVIRSADRVLELGPGSGREGGALVFDGRPEALAQRADLPTGRALARAAGEARAAVASTADIEVPITPRVATSAGAMTVVGARANNLREVTVTIPLGAVVVVTGASGSGKSTLVEEVVYRAIARARGYRDVEPPGPYRKLEGTAGIKAVTLVDQAPLGRTSRGNAATYTNAWSRIRALFAASPDAVRANLGPGHFSFNVAAGRCEACAGEGSETIEMQFLADVSLTCPSCQGRRFKDEVLAVRVDGRSVADVLALSIDEALSVFEREAAIVRALGPLRRLGLGYLALGQPLSVLSGGEAQRLKLARALGEPSAGMLFVLDEPSAGLHPEEVARMCQALRDLVRGGGSVLVVDHDLDVVRAADWVIDLGPGAGSDGGHVVAEGTPADVARTDTRTGLALRGQVEVAPHEVVPSRALAARGPEAIEVENAREHNLREVCVSIPRGKIVVVTGPSGSGKSTLAFDVVFAEGQRRFLETLTPYARQFLPTLPRPDVDRVSGVPPSIALEQRTSRSGSSSTVATVTEIAHYLRLLFAKVGDPRCPACDVPIEARSAAEILRALQQRPRSRGALLLAPAVAARKGSYMDVFTSAARSGIAEAFADGVLCATDAPPRLDKRREHSIDLVMHRGPLRGLEADTLRRALALGQGSVKLRLASGEEQLFSERRACPRCGAGVPELDPRWFSFNTKQGRCDDCQGTGLADVDDPSSHTCPTCRGSRLAPTPRAVRLAGERFHEVCARDVASAAEWAEELSFDGDRATIAEAPLAELRRRLSFVCDVGLGYLALERRAGSLSGGEMQRLRLAAQLGSGLTGALYVLDEPTIGLHPRDTKRLLRNLRSLADTGSTVLMVEHDADTIRAADHLIDLGPTGGRGGGQVVAVGTPAQVLAMPGSPTGRALAGERDVARMRPRRPPPNVGFIEVRGVRAHNLRVDDLRIPAGTMTVVAGVSGSGKSTLVRQVIYPAARRKLGLEAPEPGYHDELRLPATIERAMAVDQSPIGRTPRSVPATFLGVWDEVRRLFAASPEARVRGFGPSRFSFNSAAGGGRCPTCAGQGVIAHEMSFLPDVTTPCEACAGTRFEPATLDVRWLGLDVGQVLDLTAEEAARHFAVHPRVRRPLETMCDLGVGYLRIGQGSHTLSGGEAQRLKLAAELTGGTRPRPTLYVLDEPTTGLHLADVARLLAVLDRLVARGDTLLVIEHHPAVIACADHVVELGPEGGSGGGRVVAEGTPDQVARLRTATGLVLAELLGVAAAPAATAARRRSAAAARGAL